ncbi:unnamed protein product [Protopolystoma xenopodis]|uniref:Uncharacterized protein n=1 Tax=Protopolystoma xenopodis TaxID=117903 RepID=A0A3S5ABF2_9PLAT|nr:unnamed protein product [Protopolystoma xenopodis]
MTSSELWRGQLCNLLLPLLKPFKRLPPASVDLLEACGSVGKFADAYRLASLIVLSSRQTSLLDPGAQVTGGGGQRARQRGGHQTQAGVTGRHTAGECGWGAYDSMMEA